VGGYKEECFAQEFAGENKKGACREAAHVVSSLPRDLPLDCLCAPDLRKKRKKELSSKEPGIRNCLAGSLVAKSAVSRIVSVAGKERGPLQRLDPSSH
jgi:hypothetical protein